MRSFLPIDSGDMQDRVQIQRDLLTWVNGAEVRTPAIYATRWANVQYLSGSEQFQGQSVEATITATVQMRYCDDILPTDRLIHNGRVLEIKSVVPEQQRKTQILLECTTMGRSPMDSSLYAHLAATVGPLLAVLENGGTPAPAIFDQKVPDNYVLTDPLIVAMLISDVPTDTIGAVIALRDQRMTLEVQAVDLGAARTVKESLIAALHGWRGGLISMCLFESGGPTLYDWELVPPRYCLPVDFMISS